MDKVGYIVANQEQELNVLKKLEQEGFKWYDNDLPTSFIFSEGFLFHGFPYIISEYKDMGYVGWSYYSEDYDGNIVYNGRKEEKMKKYLVTQEFMNELVGWRDDQRLGMNTELIRSFLDVVHIEQFPGVVDDWWTDPENTVENNNRLIAIIQWLNGEDVFEVEEPHKFVVRSDVKNKSGNYIYVEVNEGITNGRYRTPKYATKFDTREEAQEWANSHQVVIEIGEEGNEVEE